MKYKKDAGYGAIHKWVRERKPKPKVCEKCNEKPPMDLANISGQYLRDIADYLYLCRSCHKLMDYTKKTRIKLSQAVKNRERNERGNFL